MRRPEQEEVEENLCARCDGCGATCYPVGSSFLSLGHQGCLAGGTWRSEDMRVELVRAQVSEALLLAGQGALRWQGLRLMQGARCVGELQVQPMPSTMPQYQYNSPLPCQPHEEPAPTYVREEAELELLYFVRARLLPTDSGREAARL